IFWMFVILISGWNMVRIFILMKHRYETDSTSIGVSTSYSRWINTFPSIGVCLSKNRITDVFTNAVKKRFPGDNPPYSHIRTLYDYLFINPNNLYLKADYCNKYNSTCGVNILDMRKELFARTCSDFMEEITFAEKVLPDCEKIFKFHELEMGYCFLANNLYDYPSIEEMPLRYTSLDKHRNLRLVLKSGLLYRYDLYINSPEDLPYFNAVFYAITSEHSIHSFNVEEIHNNKDVIDEPISQRMCKFPSESNEEGSLYSFSICMSNIRSEMEMQLCNCTIFSNKYQSRYKFLKIKLIKIFQILGNLVTKVKDHVGYNTACLPSCMEQQISYVGSREKELSKYQGKNVVEIEIASPPTVRYLRTVTQTKLDLIVAIGSVIGLFFGASLLNLMEIISMVISQIRKILKI
ncbi:hypothetical protein KR026_009088, partial [Drosophila bipectinata]